MTVADYQEKIKQLKGAIASPATPEAQKAQFKTLLAKLEAEAEKLGQPAQKPQAKAEPAKKAEPKKEPAKKEAHLNNRHGWDADVIREIAKRLEISQGYAAAIFDAAGIVLSKLPEDISAADAASKIVNSKASTINKIMKAVDEKEHDKAQKEYKAGYEKQEAAKKKKYGDDPEDCDDLIKAERERKKKSKAAAAKRANAPRHTPATKNKIAIEKVAERINGSINKRIEKGDVKKDEIKRLIAETEKFLHELRNKLKKLN